MLTVAKLKALKPKAKVYRKTDGQGLAIEVHPGGGRYWHYRYRFAGKQKIMSLGTCRSCANLAGCRDMIVSVRPSHLL